MKVIQAHLFQPELFQILYVSEKVGCTSNIVSRAKIRLYDLLLKPRKATADKNTLLIKH